jgi:hypothetical protein
MEELFPYIVITVVFLFFGLCVLQSNRALYMPAANWSLGTALSEPTQTTALDAAGAPVTTTTLVASSSRLIAYYGSLAILALYLGFGVFVLLSFARGTGAPKDTEQVMEFLLGGLSLFAPYAANKLTGAFKQT